MFVRIGFDLEFAVQSPTTVLMMLYPHPSRDATVRGNTAVRTEPNLRVEEYIDAFGNRCGRVAAPAGTLRLWSDAVVEDSGVPEPTVNGLRQHPIDELPTDTLQFLLPSRYCEVDRFSDRAWKMFGHLPPGGDRVQAVVDWVQQHVEFGYKHACATKTAWDVYEQGKGVCRDFQHLAITLCRCLNVPTRYATGYLGDIGVPADPSPMDFSAWFEVFLEGRWWTLDARHNKPRIARVLMATGRDAADVALTTSFGQVTLQKFVVWTDEVSGPSPAAPKTIQIPVDLVEEDEEPVALVGGTR